LWQRSTWLWTDAANNVDEFAFEQNNVNFDASATNINLTPPPDLEMDSVVAPAIAQAGRPLTFEYTVTNRGATRTNATSWTDAFYLSADDQFDPATDILLANRAVFFRLPPDLMSKFPTSGK
jgi:hypothetical protein